MASHDSNGKRQGRNAGVGDAAVADGQDGGQGRFPGHDQRVDNQGPSESGPQRSRDQDEGLGSTASVSDAAASAGGVKPAGGDESFDPLEALSHMLSRGANSPYGCDDDPKRRSHPALWRLLTARAGTSGRSKIPASVRVEATPTGFRATLSDLTLSVALSVECDRLDAVWDELERQIRNPKAVWRELRHGERFAAIKNANAKKSVDWENGKS